MTRTIHAYFTQKPIKNPVDINLWPFHYHHFHKWHDHANLHEYLRRTFIRKGGIGEEFFQQEVQLTLADINQLEGLILVDALPQSDDEFYPPADDASHRDASLQFIEKARALIKAGFNVYCTVW